MGCSRHIVGESLDYEETTQNKLSHYQLHLASENCLYWNYQEQYPYSTWISYSVTPVEFLNDSISDDVSLDGEDTEDASLECNNTTKVKPTKTPWAPAWDHVSVVKEMNRILLQHGVHSKTVRVRMIAHAIVASGWKQNIWNYNAWGVKQGSWEREWYVMPTYEEDDEGNEVWVEDAAWRAFSSWEEAIQDFQERISPDSERPSYRDAYTYLTSERQYFKNSKAYWEALGAGNYYTASKFTGEKFARLCGGVNAILR
ncbi:MAG: hypothetical protein JXX29_24045 [Deltaproteobacteria bacterium]|nr:hypothetical protein [Deltaproteobacteria bacterium]MBN2674775.1 hypothetical protein [Deltaproteobacteria bacterium]